MTDKLQQTIKEELSQLTGEAQSAIASIDWLKIAEDIGKQFNLEEGEEIEDLQLEILLVMIGAVDPEFFPINIENHVRTTNEEAKMIANEVSKKIFNPIIAKLPKVDSKEIKTNSIPSGQPSTSNIVSTSGTEFEKLPKEIGDIVRDSNYQSTLYAIAQKHGLSITQMGTLDTVTTDLMKGTIHPTEFKKSLLKKLNLKEEEVSMLVNEINEKVFKNIRGKLMELSGGEHTSDEDMEVLKSHGIEIISDLPAVPNTQLPQMGKPETSVQKLDVAKDIHPLLSQKMSSSVQAPTVKSNYGINNAPLSTGEVKPPAGAVPPKPTAYPKNADPYRVVPE
jgi:hypothetical protein